MDNKLQAYGHTFQSQKDLDGYKKMKSEARKRALARKTSSSSDDKEKAAIRKHFASEAKHFGL